VWLVGADVKGLFWVAFLFLNPNSFGVEAKKVGCSQGKSFFGG
jgi:hypothetical protein